MVFEIFSNFPFRVGWVRMTSGAMGSPCMVMAYIPLDTTEKKEQECI
jgi:hypothetical protein